MAQGIAFGPGFLPPKLGAQWIQLQCPFRSVCGKLAFGIAIAATGKLVQLAGKRGVLGNQSQSTDKMDQLRGAFTSCPDTGC